MQYITQANYFFIEGVVVGGRPTDSAEAQASQGGSLRLAKISAAPARICGRLPPKMVAFASFFLIWRQY